MSVHLCSWQVSWSWRCCGWSLLTLGDLLRCHGDQTWSRRRCGENLHQITDLKFFHTIMNTLALLLAYEWGSSKWPGLPLGLRAGPCPSLQLELLVRASEDDWWLGVELRTLRVWPVARNAKRLICQQQKQWLHPKSRTMYCISNRSTYFCINKQ